MGFGLKRTLKKAGGGLAGIFGVKNLGTGGAPGPLWGGSELVEPPPTTLGSSTQRKSLDTVFNDPAFSYREGPVGPSIEDDSAAYDRYLAAGEAARRREEGRAMDQVLNGLQSRGILRSGITLNDVAEKVLGPAQERANSLAATFGLEQARRRSDLLEAERARQGEINRAKLAGRLQGSLADQNLAGQLDLQNLGALQDFQHQKLAGSQEIDKLNAANAINKRNAMEERRRKRKAGLEGMLGDVAMAAFA